MGLGLSPEGDKLVRALLPIAQSIFEYLHSNVQFLIQVNDFCVERLHGFLSAEQEGGLFWGPLEPFQIWATPAPNLRVTIPLSGACLLNTRF